jgi:hypothetical protein
MAHRIENTPDVDVENPAIFGFGRLIERALPLNAGVVKGNVEFAKFVDREIDHLFYVAIFGNVRPDERRVAATFFNFGDNLRAFFFAPTG